MLSFLANFEDYFGPFRLFRYLTFRGIFSGATALFLGFVIGPWILGYLRRLKVKQTVRDASVIGKLAEKHAGKKETPTMGGLIIYFAVTISTLLWAKPNIYVITALSVYSGLTIIGFYDDYLKIVCKNSRGLEGRFKLLGQAFISFMAVIFLLVNDSSNLLIRELWVPFLKNPLVQIMPLWLLFLGFFIVIAGSSNAINLTDGIDGLAIGCVISVALVYAIMAYAAGHALIAEYLFISHVNGAGELAIVCATIVGGSLAFLWWNCYPAEVFMGDTGSLALGGLIGAIAFMIHQPITLIVVGGIFVIEAVSVIVQVGSFKLTGKRVFLMAPIHHHFELKNWAESKVVIRFWILSLIFAISGLATLKIR